jgi:hypothetical protein
LRYFSQQLTGFLAEFPHDFCPFSPFSRPGLRRAAAPLLAAVPLVAAALSGRDMTIRAMSFDEKSRSPDDVRNVIRSGDDPPMSTSWPVMVSPLFKISS